MIRYSEKTVASVEPLKLDEAANHAKALPDEAEYGLIENLIVAAREYCEGVTGRSFVEREITAYPTTLIGEICLPKPPVKSIESFVAYDNDGNAHEITDYYIDNKNGVVTVHSVPGFSLREVNPCEIKYTTGYDAVPAMARQAMLLMVGHWYINRESVVVGANASVEVDLTTRALLKQFKVWWL